MFIIHVYNIIIIIIMWIILQSNVLCIDGIGSYGQASFVLLHQVVSYPHLHWDFDATFMHTMSCIIDTDHHVYMCYSTRMNFIAISKSNNLLSNTIYRMRSKNLSLSLTHVRVYMYYSPPTHMECCLHSIVCQLKLIEKVDHIPSSTIILLRQSWLILSYRC